MMYIISVHHCKPMLYSIIWKNWAMRWRLLIIVPAIYIKKYDWKSFTSKKFDKLNSFFVTRWMFRIAKWSYLRFSLGRKKCFDEFTKNYLKLTDKTYYTFEELKMNPPCADIIIAGSDQIWNPYS